MILEVRDATGKTVYKAPDPKPGQAVSRAGRVPRHEHPRRQHRPQAEPDLGEAPRDPQRARRLAPPAAVKTGTANDARDLATYGYLGPPKDASSRPSRSGSGWATATTRTRGRRSPRSRSPRRRRSGTSSSDAQRKMPVAGFPMPRHIVSATIDAWTGGRPGPWTRATVKELFIDGTQPGAKHAIDRDGLLYSPGCGGWRVDPLKAELGPTAWDVDVASWMARARRGPGVVGRFDSRTAYFWDQPWGGTIAGRARPRGRRRARPGHGGRRGGGHGPATGAGAARSPRDEPAPRRTSRPNPPGSDARPLRRLDGTGRRARARRGRLFLLANLFASALNVVALVFIAVLLATAIEPFLAGSAARTDPPAGAGHPRRLPGVLPGGRVLACSSSRSRSPRPTRRSPGSRSCSSGPRPGPPSCSRRSGRRSSPSSPPCATGSRSRRPRRTWWSRRA